MGNNLTAYNKGGSNWIIDEIRWLDLKIAKNLPFVARSYMPLPQWIASKRAILNVQNFEDNKCFLYCILAALHPADANENRVGRYAQYIDELNMADISRFERQNPGISVNVIGFDLDKKRNKDFFIPIRVTKVRGARTHVNLLLIGDEER